MDGPPNLDLDRSRSAFGLIAATLGLYRRYSWLFLILAGVVVVPYDLIALIAYPDGPLHGAVRVIVEQALLLGDFAIVLPLVSALHVFAVEDVRGGQEPALGPVFRRGIASLRVVSPAVLLSWLGIFAGTLALIVPGIILAIRWAVVAQTGALEAKSWRDALSRSAGFTERQRRHVLAFIVLVALITALPAAIHIIVFGGSNTVGSFVVGVAFDILTSSFAALATAFLLYDLKARFRTQPKLGAVPSEPRSSSGRVVPPTGHPLDPESWSDEDRPAGWYVDPVEPTRMRYWLAGEEPHWNKRRARTPNQVYDEWIAYRKRATAEERA